MPRLPLIASSAALAFTLVAAAPPPAAPGVTKDMIQTGTDIPKDWQRPEGSFDFTVRKVEIPMRDGVKLHTVFVIPKGAANLPILFERTPYEADGFVKTDSPHLKANARPALQEFIDDGYIFAFQDIRGKYGSKGDYVMTRPPRGPLNPSKTDDTTDAYDTIDWMVKNLHESNGKVGMIGSSYDGWTVTMALLGPHPALKVAAPESPMIDGWMGDDWFHYGAFRQPNLDYFTGQTSKTGKGGEIPRWNADDYTNFLQAGSAGAYAQAGGLDQLPFWSRLSQHPAYDAFWQDQALDKAVAAKPSSVPTMWLQGLWDQEDMWGAIHSWSALKDAGHEGNNYLVMGPWRHSQVNREGRSLGPLLWSADTTADFRKNTLVPFFDTYLKDKAPAVPTPKVLIYNTAEDHWEKFATWPGAGAGAATGLTPIYLGANGALGFQKDAAPSEASYVADPAKPVPYLSRPITTPNDRWGAWLVQDQRFVDGRTDVLTYSTPVLTSAVRVQGAPMADLFAKTTGTDGDFVVKVIDVYPDDMPAGSPLSGGYELPISLDIFRGRYRQSFESPSAIPAGQVEEYRFALPTVNHVFLPGHRIMVQVQSSLFPLYDRNPQSYVPNIFFAKPADYQKATVSLEHGGTQASAVMLPVVAATTAEK